MSDTFGRDKLWTPEVWADIDKAVMAEVGRVRVAQKVFEAQPETNTANVSADILVGGQQGFSIQEGITVPFAEISAEFLLTKGQSDNEATLHAGRRLAALAARSVARAEDLIFFQGDPVAQPRVNPNAPPPNLPPLIDPARAANTAGQAGLINLPNIPVRVVNPLLPAQAGVIWGPNTFNEVAAGIADLVNNGHAGPYALYLDTITYADTYVTVGGGSTTTADRISPLVEGRFYGTGALPTRTGLLVSLGGSPTTIHVAQDAITAFTQEDQQGVYRLRVFERVQLIAREANAFVRLNFDPPPVP
jgi:uncharacterized linocin/CFP29 family protein